MLRALNGTYWVCPIRLIHLYFEKVEKNVSLFSNTRNIEFTESDENNGACMHLIMC